MTTPEFASTVELLAHYKHIRAKFFGQKTWTRKAVVEDFALPEPVDPGPTIYRDMGPQDMDRVIVDMYLRLRNQIPMTVGRIQAEVAQAAQIRMDELVGDCREARVVVPRHIAIYLCRLLTNHSFPRLGTYFGGRDHATVIHACRKFKHVSVRLGLADDECVDGQALQLSA